MTNGSPGKHGLRSWDYPATVLLIGLLSLAVLVWTDNLSQRQIVVHMSTETLRDLQVKAATAHLWLEEGLTDGEKDKLERATNDLTDAIRLSQLLLGGGTFRFGGILEPLGNPERRRQAEDIKRLLLELRAISRERVEARAGVGSPLDMRFNAVFEKLQGQAGELWGILEEDQASNHTKSRHLFSGMLVAWSAILGVSMVGLVRRERRRRQAEEALQTANNELEMRVTERTRQLRQVNDQLASELEERKRADLELQKFVSLADNSSEFIGMFDMNLMPFYVNEAGMRLLGLSGLQQVRRTPVAGFFFPEDQRFVTEEFFPRVLQTGRAEAEIRFRHFQTGEPLWMIYNVFYIKDPSGQPIALAAVSRNITERRQAQEELRTSQERLAAIVASAMDAIITLDENQRVVLFNAAAEKIFCCPASEAIGKPLDSFIPERFRQVHRSHIHAYGATGRTARSMGSPGRLSGLRANGEEFPLEATISQVSTRGQKLYTVILRDITQRKQAEELERLYAKTKDLDRLKTEFFANVSHELRTPLALILGPVKRRLSAAGLSEDEQRDLEVIQRNARLLERHVNDLLDLSKLDAGQMALDYSEVDLAHLTRLAASYFEAVAAEREVKYAIVAPEALPAEVDPHKLERILINLLSNAFKFTPAGGSVRCAIRRSGDRATLEVEDSGPGIPPHSRETIFERFRQADSRVTRQYGGTGLGLSIVKEFVTLHDGRITVTEGREGIGSLFSVDLPLRAPSGSEVQQVAADLDLEFARQAVEELESRETSWQASAPRPETDAPAVLVVEDNPDMNAFISRTLSPTYRTIQAFDGRAGLEAAATLRPDLILCDVMMPRLSGDQMVREVRRREALDDVPIVLLTAKADEELTVRMLNEGAQDYIRKPFDPEELMAKVGRLLADRRRAAEALQRTLQLSERLLEQKDELLQIVSHELRTPLTTIREGVSQVADGILGPATPEQRKFLSIALSGIDRLSRIINDLLDVAKIDAGRLDLAREHVDIVAIARQEARIFEPRARAKGLLLRTDFSQPEIEIYADPDKLAQVFANLLGNALNYTQQGEVVVTVEDLGEHVSCAVRDTGGGIAPEALPKVFQKFYQVGRTAGPGGKGTGLGLPIAKAIVELHGGEISVKSQPGVGSTFTFVLPKSPV